MMPTVETMTMTSPPPRGVGRTCELRSLGMSRSWRRSAQTSQTGYTEYVSKAVVMPRNIACKGVVIRQTGRRADQQRQGANHGHQ